MKFAVFEPPDASKKPCHCLFFLQGLTCTEENFIVKSGAQKCAASLGIYLVSPDTSPRGCNIPGEDEAFDFGSGAGFYVNATNSPWSKHYKMYDYVTKELPELIEKHFNIVPGKYGVCGHSMGGHGALVVGLRESKRFVSVSALAPISHPSGCNWGKKAFTGYLSSPEEWAMYDTVELIRTKGLRFPCTPLIDQGDQDEWLLKKELNVDLLEKTCKEAGQPIQLRYHAGYDHYYYFIKTFIDDHLKFHAANLAV